MSGVVTSSAYCCDAFVRHTPM